MKKKRLSKEELEKIIVKLNDYHTLEQDVINMVCDRLIKEKKELRRNDYNERHKSEPFSKRLHGVRVIDHFAKHAGRLRGMQRKWGEGEKETFIERNILSMDRRVLENSLKEKGYSQTEARELALRNYSMKDIWLNKSLDADDYVIQGQIMILKPAILRYYRLIDEKGEKDCEHFFTLGDSRKIRENEYQVMLEKYKAEYNAMIREEKEREE